MNTRKSDPHRLCEVPARRPGAEQLLAKEIAQKSKC
jgi:hypothetical protein